MPKIAVVLIASLCSADTTEEKVPVYKVDKIVVTASRIPSTFSNLVRNVSVIEADEIKRSPAHSVHGLLEHSGGIDVRQRGLFGVQGDISIRGGTVGQTLILIDGVKVIDPQTNHHNANLPLTLEDIERIEVMKGPGSRLYGPNAFGGVINIITKRRMEKSVRIKASGGDFGFYDGILSLSHPLGNSAHHISLSKRKSDGYRDNTEFDMWSVFYGSSVPFGSGKVSISVGHIDNEFGANSFYVDPTKSDKEWEHVRTTLINIGSDFEIGTTKLTSKLYLRRNEDHYVFNRENPALYENFHNTWSINGEHSITLLSKLGMTAVGMEAGWEKMESTRLDTLSRWKGGFFVEQHVSPTNNFLAVIGGFAYRYSGWGWQVWPGVDVGYRITGNIKILGSINRSFRIPTYTELSYYSPSNQGDPGLEPEEGWIYEAGVSWTSRMTTSKLAAFRREGKKIIDWVRASGSTDIWRARMIGDVDMNGLEAEFNAKFDRFSIAHIHGSYVFLDTDKKLGDLESAYALANLRHQIQLSVSHKLLDRFEQTWKLRYEKRAGESAHFLVDTHIKWDLGNLALFAEASNLFDAEYVDVKSLPLPGRWIRAGIDIDLMPQKKALPAEAGRA